MTRFVRVTFLMAVFVLVGSLVVSCDQSLKRAEHDALTKGCVMTGTIQGYQVGRESMPAQEQWECNGLMRTVNAI